MRIVSGEFRSRRIEPPSGLGIRPTTDRAREALFNMLTHRLDWPEVCMLELFGGSGAIALEALSRGAQSVRSVEMLPKVVDYLKQMRESFGVQDRWDIVLQRAEAFVQQDAHTYSFIFLDPPYAMPNKAAMVGQMLQRGMLALDGLLVMEHGSHEQFGHLPGFLEARTYGSSTFTFLEKAEIKPT